MTYLWAVFIPPLYFLLHSKWVSFTVNSILCGFAAILALTNFSLAAASLLWIAAVLHAGLMLCKETVIEHAIRIAGEMGAEMVNGRPLEK